MPLDTNLVEQKLIIPVRYLAASFNYQTETGAEVGDRMMSLIATAQANGAEPVAYLTDCLRNREELSRGGPPTTCLGSGAIDSARKPDRPAIGGLSLTPLPLPSATSPAFFHALASAHAAYDPLQPSSSRLLEQ